MNSPIVETARRSIRPWSGRRSVAALALLLCALFCWNGTVRADPPPDGDGDGVPDADDNCPLVFNPPDVPVHRKLSGTMTLNGDVTARWMLAPDDANVVYVADQEIDEQKELYRVPLGGGMPTKLNETLAVGGDVYADPDSVTISPDGLTVGYVADQEVDDRLELFQVSLFGGPATRLNEPLPPGRFVRRFHFTPDGSRLIYFADEDVAADIELFQVPSGGGAAHQLNAALPPNGAIWPNIRISPDDATLVYRGEQEVDGLVELFSVPIDGGDPVKLSGPFVRPGGGSGFVDGDFRISPDGSTVVYRADQNTAGIYELYTVPIGGGTATRLNGPLAPGGLVYEFDISPDGDRVVYRANQDEPALIELYSAPIGGGPFVKLNDPSLHPVAEVFEFAISPDGALVVYLSLRGDFTWGGYEMFVVPIGGGTSSRVIDPPLPWNRQIYEPLIIAPDGATVVYRSQQGTGGFRELYTIPISGGSSTKLNGPFSAAGGQVLDFILTPDSGSVIYISDPNVRWQNELFRVPIAGGTAVKLNGPLPPSGNVEGGLIAVTSDGSNVIYRADEETDGVLELFASGAIQLDGDGDGWGDACDCASADPTAAQAPTILASSIAVDRSGGSMIVSWPGVELTYGVGTSYDVVRGSLLQLRSMGYPAGATCVSNDLPNSPHAEVDGDCNPAPGDGCWYLIRAQNLCGTGGYGSLTSGPLPLDTDSPCP